MITEETYLHVSFVISNYKLIPTSERNLKSTSNEQGQKQFSVVRELDGKK